MCVLITQLVNLAVSREERGAVGHLGHSAMCRQCRGRGNSCAEYGPMRMCVADER